MGVYRKMTVIHFYYYNDLGLWQDWIKYQWEFTQFTVLRFMPLNIQCLTGAPKLGGRIWMYICPESLYTVNEDWEALPKGSSDLRWTELHFWVPAVSIYFRGILG